MKKVFLPLLSIILCLFLNANIFAQDNRTDYGSGSIMGNGIAPIVLAPTVDYYSAWYPTGTFPDIPAATLYAASAIVGDTLYAQTPDGAGGAGTTTFLKYYIGTVGIGGGSWITGPAMPAAKTQGAMVACGGNIYYIGGGATAASGGSTTVYMYSPATGVWTTKAPMPIARDGHGAVCWGDSVIFVMGGPWSTSPTTNLQVFVYRPATDTWTTLTGTNALPSGAGRRAFGIGLDGNKIIIAGGYAGAYLKSAYVGTIGANASTITWAAAPDVSTTYPGLSRMGGTACNGYFITIGGERSGGTPLYEDTCHVYSFGSNTWVYNFGGKPTGSSNIFNANSSKLFPNDTIKIFSVGAYNGAALPSFEVAKFKATPGVGIKDIINANTFSMFPNPTNSVLNITVNENVTVEIINISGQLVSNQQLLAGNNKVDVSAYAKGIYFVTVKGNQISKTQKLVIQ
jgi:hypothetical protein